MAQFAPSPLYLTKGHQYFVAAMWRLCECRCAVCRFSWDSAEEKLSRAQRGAEGVSAKKVEAGKAGPEAGTPVGRRFPDQQPSISGAQVLEPSTCLLLISSSFGKLVSFGALTTRMCCICVHVYMQADENSKEASPSRDAAAGLETVVSDEDGWHSVMSSRCA